MIGIVCSHSKGRGGADVVSAKEELLVVLVCEPIPGDVLLLYVALVKVTLSQYHVLRLICLSTRHRLASTSRIFSSIELIVN